MTEATTQTDYLTRAEAAARCRVPLPTFDKLRRDGLIPEPDAEVGKHKLWRADTIDEFAERIDAGFVQIPKVTQECDGGTGRSAI